jgi:hypothetical protein
MPFDSSAILHRFSPGLGPATGSVKDRAGKESGKGKLKAEKGESAVKTAGFGLIRTSGVSELAPELPFLSHPAWRESAFGFTVYDMQGRTWVCLLGMCVREDREDWESLAAASTSSFACQMGGTLCVRLV